MVPERQRDDDFENWVGNLFMGFQDVVFLPSKANFPPYFLRIVVEVKAS